MLIGLRELRQGTARKRGEKLSYWLWKEIVRRPWLYHLALRAAGLLARAGAKDGWLRRLPGPAAGWTAIRDFPAPASRSFRDRWHEL
jgi:L-lactate dehydrogenase complex protein LldF